MKKLICNFGIYFAFSFGRNVRLPIASYGKVGAEDAKNFIHCPAFFDFDSLLGSSLAGDKRINVRIAFDINDFY